jgi:hypothetical protein
MDTGSLKQAHSGTVNMSKKHGMKKEEEKEVWTGASMRSGIQTTEMRHTQSQEGEGIGLRIV